MKSYVCILPEDALDNENSSLITLPHPRTGTPARYLFTARDLLEVQKIEEEHPRSWFIDNMVERDGNLFVFTPVDIMFILLPVLEAGRMKTEDAAGRFLPLDDSLESELYPQLSLLSGIHEVEKKLCSICDVQDIGGNFKTFRLNDARTIQWLRDKVEKLASHFDEFETLKELNSSLDISNFEEERRKKIYLNTAVHIVSEYLPESWVERLSKTYDFSDVEDASVSVLQNYLLNENDRVSRPSRLSMIEESQQAKKTKLTPRQRALAKASSKMKPLTSFFGKAEPKS
ncbi:uncharacterized protein VTP21DRAFT_6497 [Calcarisporiella thermophila]|uniref:uncharacterized protein n=1 Tax=Calcarisporiella thermophila TaxID=911321 RepID=UPI003743103F